MDDQPLRTQDLLDRFDLLGRFDLRRSTLLPRVGSALAVLAIAGVGWWLLRPAPPPVESVIPMETTTTGTASALPSETTLVVEGEPAVVVAAAGAVANPGVYRLDAGARVQDLVTSAGGFSDRADKNRVNLAALVHDGERIWVPGRGDVEVPSVVAGSGGGVPVGSGGAPDAQPPLIDLNTATEAELEELPGVGPATAASILSHREKVGRFGSVEELLDVRGIGEAKLEQIQPLVTV